MKRNTIKTTVIFIGQQQRKKDWCPVNKTVSAYDCVSPLYFFFLLKYEETASGSFDSEAEKKNTFCECFDSVAEKGVLRPCGLSKSPLDFSSSLSNAHWLTLPG